MDSFYSCFYSLSLCPQLIARHDMLEYEIRVIVIWVITHNVWTSQSQSSHRASGHNWPPAVCAGLRGHILARNFHFPQYYFAKFYKVSAVQYHIEYLFLQPKFDLGSVTSRDWNCPKLWKSFTIFILSSPCVIRQCCPVRCWPGIRGL